MPRDDKPIRGDPARHRDRRNRGPTTASREQLNEIEQMMERIATLEERGDHQEARRLSRKLMQDLGII